MTGGLDNAKGKIEVTGTDTNDKANVTINGLTNNTDLEAVPASVFMGDITLTHATPPSRTKTRATSSRPKPTRRKAKTTRSPKRASA